MYKNVLVPMDGSELAECVLPHVETVVKGCGTKKVTFIRVVEPVVLPIGIGGEYFNAQVMTEMEEYETSSAQNYLDEITEKIGYEGVTVEAKLLQGRAAESLIDYALANKIDLIIIATHGRSGISRWVRGSVANHILHSATVPILMIQSAVKT